MKMKKKFAWLLAAFGILGMLAGCGKEDGTVKDETGQYVTLGDYQNMEVELAKSEVTEEDIAAYVSSMIASNPAYETLPKTVVEDGDTVDIDYEGKRDGVAFEGGTAKGSKLVIGSKSFIDGFESGLVGANVGETRTLDLTFPDPYKNNPDLAGKPVVFTVTVNAIVQKQDMSYETLTDEYVSANLGYDTVQAMKDGVKESLTSQKESSAESDKRTAILSKLRELCVVNSLPEGLLDERVAKYRTQVEAMCQEQYSMELAAYLESINQTEEDFLKEVTDYMKENIEVELILTAVARAEGVEADEEGLKDYVDKMVAYYSFEDAQGLYDEYGEDYVKTSYLCSKVMDQLAEKVAVKYVESGAENGAADDVVNE